VFSAYYQIPALDIQHYQNHAKKALRREIDKSATWF
jgi:hypothetical protein